MGVDVDPQRNEIRALARASAWRGRRVLEIGCGEGRLTLRLARLGAEIHAIDPDPKRVRVARRELPAKLAARVTYRVGSVRRVNFAAQRFDLAIFAWSL